MSISASSTVAIVGLSCRFPGGVNDVESLWQLLCEGRNTWSDVPVDRYNWRSFYHPSRESKAGHSHRGGHFLDQDVTAFDAAFFNISRDEAEAMDPQQRLQLEVAYEAIENAGYSVESIRGSNTGVFVATFLHDFEDMMYKDTMNLPKYGSTGVWQTMVSNRISYAFDLKGPSITLNTGCSGSLVALHQACQSLKLGESNLSLVGGTNLILSPDAMIPMDLLHLLNQDGNCFSFDARGSGYGRGEGTAMVVLKRLDDALRDRDSIRGIIRGTATGHNGKTAGIMLPNEVAQKDIILSAFRSARLDPSEVGYIEAHGTGTVAGDEAEINAINGVFCKQRDAANLLFVGSIKANIGHLEATSGLAGLIKALLILEKSMIPSTPNLKAFKEETIALYAKINVWHHMKGFGTGLTHFQIPKGLQPWPRDLARRASIGHNSLPVCVGENSSNVLHLAQIFAITAKSEHSLVAASLNLRKWASRKDQSGSYHRRLAYTLACRRSLMYWRYAFTASTHKEILAALDPQALRKTRTANHNQLAFVFTGQGAQWPRMAQRLLSDCRIFKDSVLQSAAILGELGASWNIFEELNRDDATSRLKESEIGQPATTVLQIALVETLQSWNITPNIVLGHSSGEIAAAYTAGALTKRSAIMVSYHRGFLARRCKEILKTNGAMLVVSLGEQGVESYVSRLTTGRLQVACLNSPTSSTVSGDEGAILELERLLDWSSIGYQRLNVDTAYHSHHMRAVAEAYSRDLKDLDSSPISSPMRFYSSVTTEEKTSDFGVAYWVENLVSKVCFFHAVENICQTMRCDHSTNGSSSYNTFVEIGPHTTLIRPVKQTLTHLKLDNFQGNCITTLTRNRDSSATLLQTAATLFTLGFPVDLIRANASADVDPDSDSTPINDLPPYPWNHSTSYWHESRLSRDHRLRPHPYHDLLGLKSLGSLDLDPTWRHTLRVDDLPWLKDHKVEGRIVFPGSAYIAMVVEAKKQILLGHHNPSKIKYYILKDVVFHNILVIPEAPEIFEIQLNLHTPMGTTSPETIVWEEFRICSIAQSGEVSEHCYGKVSVEAYSDENHMVALKEAKVDYTLDTEIWNCKTFSKTTLTSYDPKRMYRKLQARGNYWGPSFALIREFDAIECSAVGTVEVGQIAKSMPAGFMQPHVIHPATLDALIHTSIFLWGRSGGRDITLPVRVGEIKISADVVVNPGQMLAFETKIYPQNDSSTLFQVYAYREGQRSGLYPCIQLRDGELRAAVRSRYPATGSLGSQDLCYQLEWDDDFDFCNPSINTASLVAHGGGEIPSQRRLERLNTVARDFMRDCSLNITRDEIEKRHLRYYDWMTGLPQLQSRQNAARAKPVLSHQARNSLDVEEELLKRVGSKLTAVLKGKVDPLSLLLKDNLLSRMYSEDLTIKACYSHLITYLKGLIFKYPNMKMLEIGAGTGGLTVPFLQSIASNEKLPLHIYFFTDISSGYFKDARQRLATWADQIQYKSLDIGESPAKQGLEEGSFDLVLASNALHVTKSVNEAIMNARRLLKPGGRLVFIETTRLQLFTSMTFGVLPGWFLDRHDGRKDSPMLSTEQWHERLLRSSFAGVEFAKSDSDEHDARMTMMVTRATCTPSVSKFLKPISIFDCPTSREENRALFKGITQALVKRSMQFLEVLTPLSKIDPEAIYMVMDSTEHPLVTAADTNILETLKWLLLKATNLLWITSAKDATTATNHGADWISDVVLASRSENIGLKFVTIMVKRATGGNAVATTSDQISKIFQESFCTANDTQALETKYFLGNGKVLIPRLKPNVRFQQRRQRIADPARTPVLFHQPDLTLRLAIQKTEKEPRMSFEIAPSHSNPMSPTDIEIQVEAYGLNPDKVELLSGQPQVLNVDKMLGECAGIVIAIGSGLCHQYSLGDRVCAWGEVPCANRIRVNGNNVTHLPSTVTSQAGASIPLAFLSAYYSLVVLARITTNCSILVQDAADSSGQAAIQLAIDHNANVFAVVRNKEEQAAVLEMFALPHDHVFLETLSFHRQVIELTYGQGVDITIALSSSPSAESSKCVARFGKQIVKAGLELASRSFQGEKICRKNTSFISFDLADILRYRPEETKPDLSQLGSMFEVKRRRPIHPTINMDMAHIEEAFGLAQKKDQFGKVVVTADPNTLVNCLPPKPPELKLCRNGTYVLSGDFGDLGLEICKFITLHGARHVLFANTLNAWIGAEQNLADVCRELGIHFQVISFDKAKKPISEKEQPSQRRGFTPVKGIFYGRMVQQTRLVEETSINELVQSLESSIDTIDWLYDSYWSPDLDFFLTLSSSKRLLAGKYHEEFPFGMSNNIKPRMMRDADSRKFVQIDLSGMEDSCLKVSRLDLNDGLTREGLVPMTGADLGFILECAMSLTISDHDGQRIIAGFDSLSVAKSKNRSALDGPIFSHIGALDTDQVNTQLPQHSSVEEWSIKGVQTREKARLIVTAALVQEIASHVAVEQSMIDTNIAIEDFGMDSLVQWDLRSYISTTFEVDLSAKELASAESVTELAHLVVDRALIGVSNRHTREMKLERENPEVVQTEPLLPRQPLPSLQDSLKVLLDAVRPFLSDGEFEMTCVTVEMFQEHGGLGEQLQHRLLLREGDPRAENWLTDLYTTHRFLRLRQTLVAHSSYFFSHPTGSVSHGQAERAAVITLASLLLKQKLESGQLLTQHLPTSGQIVDPTSYHWMFNTCREAHIEEDRIHKHPTNNYVVVLRYGQFFKINLSTSTGNLAFRDLVAVYQQILDDTPKVESLVSVLTTGDRNMWAKTREQLVNVNLENKASIRTIEAAAFIVCLDHASPETPMDRFRQFLFSDTNRWYDKTLQHIVCPNSVSASLYEHAALDGLSVRPLVVDIAAAVLDPRGAANALEQASVTSLRTTVEPLNISADSSFDRAIMQCRQRLREMTSLLTFASLTTSRLGVSFLQKHKCPVQSGVQLAIQLACRRFYGYTLPAYETVSMAHFRKGRVEVNAIIGPAVMRFLDVAASESRASSTTFKTLLYDATTEHNRRLSRAIQGKAYNRHMLALEWMLEEGESRPALFDDIGYAKSKPGKVMVSHIPLGGLEGGFAYPVPGSILVYYDIQGESVSFSISGNGVDASKFLDLLRAAVDEFRGILVNDPHEG